MSQGHRQVDRNVARASPSPNKVEYQVIRITMIRWSSSNTSGLHYYYYYYYYYYDYYHYYYYYYYYYCYCYYYYYYLYRYHY